MPLCGAYQGSCWLTRWKMKLFVNVFVAAHTNTAHRPYRNAQFRQTRVQQYQRDEVPTATEPDPLSARHCLGGFQGKYPQVVGGWAETHRS